MLLVYEISGLAAYDKVILSFFGACGTQVGDPSITASIKKIEENCIEHGGDKFQIMSTDLYADFQKAFPAAGVNGVWDASWKSLNYGGLMGVLKKLTETTDTEVGVSIFGWSLSNIVSDAVKPENRQVLVTSLVRFINAYPFITQIDIDWEYPGVRGAANNVFDPQNDAGNYAAFIKLLRQELNNNGRNSVKLAIAAGAPKNIIDAANLKSLVDSGVDTIHLMTYDFFGEIWSESLGHHTNLKRNENSTLSADDSIQYMIKTLGIDTKHMGESLILTGTIIPSHLSAWGMG
ncbi:hypothetical protein GZ77_22040 [Endozoicomonas montiporae]|uniref:chitinase n=1 Tax=Endozoicomonas montiporae TaxID=1027273 RepID=A0A081N043_9GAMM|nr:glycosyl hydrolase family 18 protein [Endozoicomonas montiporae]KEQ11816.1 hypothetical protein GZ77_22040 [Endozoicomonas montiporae]